MTQQMEPPVIIFDGVCNLCNASVNFIIARDPEARFRFTSAQSDAGSALQERYGIDAVGEATFILIKKGKAYTKSDAAIQIARELGGGWKLLSCAGIIPRPLRDRLYAFVAKNRYRWFGKKEECMLPTPALRKRFLA